MKNSPPSADAGTVTGQGVRTTPILLTGTHRSGSTFVGRILSAPREIAYIPEPFSKRYGLEEIDHWFLYLRKGMKGEDRYVRMIEQLLRGDAHYKIPPSGGFEATPLWKSMARRLVGTRRQLEYWWATRSPWVQRYVIKDPLAALASEYLHREFGMDVLVLMRHPAAFVASIKRATRLHWGSFDFTEFLRQEELMDDHLSGLLAGRDLSGLSVVEAAALQWTCICTVLGTYLRRNERMLVVRHEDLSAVSKRAFSELFCALGIPWNSRVEATLQSMTNESNPVDPVDDRIHSLKRDSLQNIKRWKQILSSDEIACIREVTAGVAERYYGPDDW